MRSVWITAGCAVALVLTSCHETHRQGDAPGGGPVRPGCNRRVLVIGDEVPGGAAPLAVALTAAGFDVTTASATSSEFAGVPLVDAPRPFGVVVLLDGKMLEPPADMPREGQQAIFDFVRGGHGLVLTEWAAFHIVAKPTPRWQVLEPLVLLDRRDSYVGNVTYEIDPAFASHPIWAGLPPSFTFASMSNVGTVRQGPGVAKVAHSPQANDAVAIRDLPSSGRVVHVSHAGNQITAGWANVNLQRLITNAAGWAARCEPH